MKNVHSVSAYYIGKDIGSVITFDDISNDSDTTGSVKTRTRLTTVNTGSVRIHSVHDKYITAIGALPNRTPRPRVLLNYQLPRWKLSELLFLD